MPVIRGTAPRVCPIHTAQTVGPKACSPPRYLYFTSSAPLFTLSNSDSVLTRMFANFRVAPAFVFPVASHGEVAYKNRASQILQ
jgi:hypothetical protein